MIKNTTVNVSSIGNIYDRVTRAEDACMWNAKSIFQKSELLHRELKKVFILATQLKLLLEKQILSSFAVDRDRDTSDKTPIYGRDLEAIL